MNITIIGVGYVGLVTGACLAEVGNQVTCVDINQEKIAGLKRGELPIYEPGLEELVKKNYAAGRLRFVTSIDQAQETSLVYFIAVGTPSRSDGSADLKYVREAAKSIGRYIQEYSIVINKSTVPVGTAEMVREMVKANLKKPVEFDIVSNPEFLKEGDAVNDFMKPDRVVVGVGSEKAKAVMEELYAPFVDGKRKLFIMSPIDAEMTKYVSNAMLATKISFMNEIALLCERIGADVDKVREGMSSDSRIGYPFHFPGCGYGGSCFPKDIKALIHMAQDQHFNPLILHAVEQRNELQKQVLHKKIIRKFGEDLSNVTLALWGLAFKPGTDDMREATSLVFLESVIERGATVHAYDPVAMDVARHECPKEWFVTGQLQCVASLYDALKNADALVLVTDWKEFKSPDWDLVKKSMKGRLILDGRNQYEPKMLQDLGFEYHGIGR